MKIKKYYKKGIFMIEGLSFDHVIPRIARSSGKNVCRISLPKELDGKRVYVLVDMNGLNGYDIQEQQEKEVVKQPKPVAPGQ